MHAFVYMRMRVYALLCMCARVYVYMCVCVFMFVCEWGGVCMFKCLYLCIGGYVHAAMPICVYVSISECM